MSVANEDEPSNQRANLIVRLSPTAPTYFMSTERDPQFTPSPKTAGTRRITLDLAKFSLDLGWARGVGDPSARNEAYPSPPMSGSPSHPARHKNEFDDRVYGGFGGPLHARQQIGGGSGSQDVEREGMRDNVVSYGHNAQVMGGQYGMYHQGVNAQVDQTQYQYPAPSQGLNQQRPLPSYQSSNSVQPLNPFVPERVPNNAPPEPAPAPKTQRKTKGHVLSACVPCKHAHLRCDEMRPCTRCVTGRKEDSCIDVQHKKRGRPRLRDDRENRFDSNLFTRGPELLRRPIYTGDGHGILGDPLRNSYRVLKSQAGPSQPAARYLDRASVSDANIYGAPAQRQTIPQDIPCAYLNIDFEIIKATRAFCDAVGLPSVASRKLQDLVVMGDRERVERVKDEYTMQRQRRESQYLPRPPSRNDEDTVILSVGFGVEEIRRLQLGSHGVVSFQGMNGEHRSFELKVSLANRGTTHFIYVKLAPAPQQPVAPQVLPFSNYSRDQQYGFQQSFQPAYTPQQFQNYQYQTPMQVQPSPQQHTYEEPRVQDHNLMYRSMTNTTTPIQQTMPLTASMLNSDVSAYARPSSSASIMMRSENAYSQPQYSPQASRNDTMHQEPQQMHQGRPMTAKSDHVQLPPIRNQGSPAISGGIGMGSMVAPGSAFRDGSSRVDIGGLLERPASQRRTSRG